MEVKAKLRKKFTLIRKRNYFDINPKVFNPLILYLQRKKIYKKRKMIISIYYPTNFEFNILKIFENEKFKRFITLLPVIKKNNQMNFFRWNFNDVLKVNKYGILEPIIKTKQYLPDIIFVPLVAYDNVKMRLGYGKGYYDKFLSAFLKNNREVDTIGMGFSFQKFKKLPVVKHDIRLNKVFTEKGFEK